MSNADKARQAIIVAKLTGENNRKAVEWALLALYQCQTPDEQSSDCTIEDNGMGFNGLDANYASKLVEWMQTPITVPCLVYISPVKNGGFQYYRHLSKKQADAAAKLLCKYWRQIEELAEDAKKESVR